MDFSPNRSMYVLKRDGRKEEVSFDKVLERIKRASDNLTVNPAAIAQKILAQIYDGVKTTELDELTSQLSANLATVHPDYGTLAARITVSNHHKNTDPSFCAVMNTLGNQKMPKTGEPMSYISEELLDVIKRHGREIDAYIQHDRDYFFDYFGFKTLEKSYLLKDATGKILERPQYVWMRVALALWSNDISRAFETYDIMSHKYFTHATPTLFNAGTPRQQLSSCFLLSIHDDSIAGIYKTLSDCAMISKYAGGIGLHCHSIRAKGSIIRGTNGMSNGLVPMLRVFNNTARYVDQGGGKRNGSFAIYLEPWHADVEDFLRLKLNSGTEEERARDLFYALWISDLFMKRVEQDGEWTLFCPTEAPGLADVVGEQFEELYIRYEREGRGRKTVSAQKLWFQILDTQMETGTPYILYKDAANLKSNQKNLGTIKSSNLCVAPETLILTDKGHVEISTLENETVKVWNGERWSTTTVHKTGVTQRLIHVNLSNGASLHCTPYHKFIIREAYHDRKPLKDATRVAAQDLKEGMKLAKCDFPVMEGNANENILHPYTHGFFCGDGTMNNGKKILCLYGEKQNLIEHLAIRSSTYTPDATGRINTCLPDELKEKFYVPMNASIKCRLDWFAGLLDSDGCIVRNGDNESAQICSIHFTFLEDIRLMLQTLGVSAKVTKSRDVHVAILPDGHGGKKEFNCQAIWRILISSSGLYRLGNLGLTTHRLVWTIREPQRNAEQFVTVESVIDLGRVDDTYCFNEPANHAGVFNGILTGNCVEIIEYSDANESAVCNLASIGLPAFVKDGVFQFDKLEYVTRIAIRNLNRVIDINYYPTVETRRSNMRHRPVGLGIQGLADVFALMRYAWDSKEAADLNQRIAEHMYFAALTESCALAQKEGAYETYQGSPVSKGILQPDMWHVIPLTEQDGTLAWSALRESIMAHGIRNSLLMAPMPTASTSQILGYNECFEPFTSNIYSRRTLAGEFIVMNKYLLKDLVERGLWNDNLKQKILAQNGSVLGIKEIPEDIQFLYRTAWELKQRTLIDLAAQRGAFICQSQSLNLFVADPSYAKMTSMHFHAWKQGLKSGCYYLRTRAAVTAQKFTVDPTLLATLEQEKEKEKEKVPDTNEAQNKKKERQEYLDKLAKEYEAAEAEGCLMCSG